MAEFHPAARTGELAEGSCRAFTVAGRAIALVRLGGEVYALDDMCPHRGGSLGAGTIEGGQIVCPMHGWKFDIKTGRLPMGGGVATHAVRIEGDQILVEI